jgi:DNA repair protein RecN (Recombination protein N)
VPVLCCLRVRQLAIIDTLDLELGPGLNVVTGETGAGKSILVEALKLVLGGRARADIVRAGAEEAVIEALFDLTQAPDLRARVEASFGRADDELVIRRSLRSEGRSRAWINGNLATAVQLAELTSGLVDICSQHEHHTLGDPSSHLRFLDAFARLEEPRAGVSSAWDRCSRAIGALEDAARQARERLDREAVARFQLDEIAQLDPRSGEVEELEQEHGLLAHADRIAATTRSAELDLYARDGAIVDQLARLHHGLAGLAGVDGSLDELIGRLDAVRTDLEDLARELGRFARGVVADPERLRVVDERLASLRRLERRFGGTLDRVIERRAQLTAELAGWDGLEDRLEALESERQVATEHLVGVARSLSARRHDAARTLGAAITDELQALGMGQARVEVDLSRLDGRAPGGVEVGGVRYTATGMDRVELLIAPNKGEPPKPLVRIASGGELSRSLLAIKRVLARHGPAGLYVFDEVDSGVGGGVAEVIGRKLDEVARHHQVLCITHLPQIAVYGDRHLHVRKATDGERTRSEVQLLEGEVRIEELARMMGGVQVTDATRAAAADLLAQAAAHR